MKKIIFLIILMFSFFSTVYSIENYNILSVKVKIDNYKYDSCYIMNKWQPWQNIEGQLVIDKSKHIIILSTNNKNNIIYDYYNDKKEEYDINHSLECFYANNYTLCVYICEDNLYFYIRDEYNKIEVIYKLNKFKS